MRAALIAGGGLVAVLLAPLLLIATLLGSLATTAPTSTLNMAAIPATAAQHLATITAVTAAECPELPPVWVIAHIDAESSWNPAAFSRDRNGGAAGLYQLNEANWRDAGGDDWAATPPPADADVLQPDEHLRRAIPWVCANLRTAAKHLQDTGKPTPALDGMLVCHIAGCSRLTASATGIPVAGEAGCDRRCAELVAGYLDRVHDLVAQYSSTGGPVTVDDLPAPTPFRGTDAACTAPDPTGGSCLTPATRHVHDEIARVFGTAGAGAPIRAAGCWDEHAWNPASDHSRGRACDYFPGAPGEFAQGAELRNGWRLATWLRTHAVALKIKYVIWQGRYWSPGTPDDGGWGRPYTGGGVYDVRDATGGHFDHVHISVGSA
ncbi:transglycosylase SLT domain-containing protein [Pseudonocardia kunmingensis]|uniref:Transglycosylase-like protein with SLT domain n=1 Tax=Pseudonocardia kunmingensis TaxID=630975 RepID=A0A543DKD0_9PSEU|nr:transglycosylase SLT domain-containing protein [Pseudonocardia kunmingensis]TQM09796.1 transglycosylase-like protein with SLT domain [Pseudonocardia kunmingensis]